MVFQQIGFQFNKAAEKVQSNHPETTARNDAMAVAVEPHFQLRNDSDPVTRPLKNAFQDRQTAAILRNYALAFKAINAPSEPAAVEAAKNAATGPAAAHAVPLYALYTVMNVQPPAGKARRLIRPSAGGELPVRAGPCLENLSGTQHQAEEHAADRRRQEESGVRSRLFPRCGSGMAGRGGCRRSVRRRRAAEAERKSKQKSDQIAEKSIKKK